MPDILCPVKIECPCSDNPFANLSSEAPDLPVFLGTYSAHQTPPLGTDWDFFDCTDTCESTVSQDAADLCAAERAFLCAISSWRSPSSNGRALPPVPGPRGPASNGPRYLPYISTEQSCSALCGDGLPFVFTVPAGVFAGLTQLQADAKAKSYACRQAQLRRICLSSLNTPICVNVPYNAAIFATGRFLAQGTQTNFWQLEAGTLPPGLVFHGGALTGNMATITGTPTTTGSYTFFIGITDPQGDFMAKGYTIVVSTVTNAGSLPEATEDMPYTAQLTAPGFEEPIFTITAGSLPDGLSMDEEGAITGTPTTAGTSNFTVRVADATSSCVAQASIKVNPGCVLGYTFTDISGMMEDPDSPGNFVGDGTTGTQQCRIVFRSPTPHLTGVSITANWYYDAGADQFFPPAVSGTLNGVPIVFDDNYSFRTVGAVPFPTFTTDGCVEVTLLVNCIYPFPLGVGSGLTLSLF